MKRVFSALLLSFALFSVGCAHSHRGCNCGGDKPAKTSHECGCAKEGKECKCKPCDGECSTEKKS